MDETRLSRIESKLDSVLEIHNKAVLEHGNRLTKLETEAGFVKTAASIAIAVIIGVCTWAFRKVFG